MSNVLIGCIADDFTGASDAASFLAKSGLKTLLVNEIPAGGLPVDGCDAVVVGMKTRSIPPQDAVRSTVKALEWLQRLEPRQYYIKYCSTFDSTPRGNIGPTVDAAMDMLEAECTVLCPSLPVNGRTVRAGRLYVNGVPLAESPMKHHPLNPMWASDIPELMRPQGRYPCLVLGAGTGDAAREAAEGFRRQHGRCYLVPDYETDQQGRQIAETWGHLKLLTGGSGLLEHLAGRARGARTGGMAYTGTRGRALMLCGSCSQATGEQIRCFRASGGAAVAVDPRALSSGAQTAEGLWEAIQERAPEPVLVYSVGAEQSEEQRRQAGAGAARLLEKTMAELGKRAVEAGFSRLIVAGGETSGAVMLALGMEAFYIGPSVAPGVPVMIPAGKTGMRVVLKSGNFGQGDFFARALEMTRMDGEL